MRMVNRNKIECSVCGKKISEANITKHQRTKKCKNFKNKNNKTDTGELFTPSTLGVSTSGGVSESKIVTEINMKGEFDKMVEKVNPKNKEEAFECGSCGKKFNEKYACCPHCGCEFEE